jgi:hypothetical protein
MYAIAPQTIWLPRGFYLSGIAITLLERLPQSNGYAQAAGIPGIREPALLGNAPGMPARRAET